MIKIAIDPGHGMSNITDDVYDPGAVHKNRVEADINLAVALTLKAECVAERTAYYMIRDDKTDHVPVELRDDRAHAAGCTHYVSIHCNAGPASARGIEVFYRDAGDKDFGGRFLAAFKARFPGLPIRGLKHESLTARGRLAVMSFQGYAILIECGFVTNDADSIAIQSRAFRLALADAVLAAVGIDNADAG